ncbi:hypothetical protein HOE04_01380 [archaeon]|jgi:hypothetical protein|nr:hypothetical protein [archaeon]
MGQQTLYEKRKASGKLILTSKETDKNKILQRNYIKIGSFNPLNEEDFGTEDYNDPNHIPIRLIGSLEEPSIETREGLVRLLKKVEELGIDPTIANDPFLQKQLLESQLINGEAYLLRFKPTNQQTQEALKGRNMCEIYVSSDNDVPLILNRGKVMQELNEIQPLEGQLRYVINRESFEGNLSLDYLGKITNAHRVNLSPFMAKGRRGLHENPARVILLGEEE